MDGWHGEGVRAVTVALYDVEEGLVTTISAGISVVKLVQARASGPQDIIDGKIDRGGLPAMFIFLVNETPRSGAKTMGAVPSDMATDRIAVAICTRSHRSQDDSRTNRTTGAYALKTALVNLLRNNDLGVTGFQGLMYSGFSFVFSDDVTTIYRADFDAIMEV